MEPPKIYEIKSSNSNTNTALVLIKGYTTQDNRKPKHHNDWIKKFREAGFSGSIYYLWWDSSKWLNVPGQALCGKDIYQKAKHRSKESSKEVMRLVREKIRESEVIFVCHSFGAKIIYDCLSKHNLQHYDKKIKNVLLLGGALKRDKNWDAVLSKIKGNLVNVYSDWDETIKGVKVMENGKKLIGEKKIKNDNVINIKVDCFHGGYKDKLTKDSIKKYLAC